MGVGDGKTKGVFVGEGVKVGRLVISLRAVGCAVGVHVGGSALGVEVKVGTKIVGTGGGGGNGFMKRYGFWNNKRTTIATNTIPMSRIIDRKSQMDCFMSFVLNCYDV